MNDTALDFGNHFSSIGGYFNYHLTGMAEMYDFTVGEFNSKMLAYQRTYPDLPTPAIHFINNNLLNAVASKDKYSGKYYIGIYAGTFILLNELFLRMLSSPKVLPHIGDVLKEEPTKKLFNPQQYDLDTYFLAKPNDENIMPKDWTRQLYATLFAKTALNFLFDHEYAHIAFGHVDYLATYKDVFSIFEGELINDLSLDLQSLEMDADSFAAYQGLGLLKSINDNPSQLPAYRSAFFCDWKNGLSNWFFSVYCLFRIFGYKNYEHSNLLMYSHPPTGIRQRLIADSLYQYFTKHSDFGNEGEFYAIYHSAIDSVEKAFNEISETELNRTAIDFAYTPDAEKHMRSIVRNWHNVRVKLEKHAKGYLA